MVWVGSIYLSLVTKVEFNIYERDGISDENMLGLSQLETLKEFRFTGISLVLPYSFDGEIASILGNQRSLKSLTISNENISIDPIVWIEFCPY